jgi:hypothetical protein
MIRIALVLLIFSALTGCGNKVVVRSDGLATTGQGPEAVFYTPTHAFQCIAGNLSGSMPIDMVPGAVFRGGVLSEKPLSIFESRGRTETMLSRDAIGLRLGEHPATLRYWFLIINSDGEFAVPGFPIALHTKDPAVEMRSGWDWQCTNKAGIRPFKLVRKPAGNL